MLIHDYLLMSSTPSSYFSMQRKIQEIYLYGGDKNPPTKKLEIPSASSTKHRKPL